MRNATIRHYYSMPTIITTINGSCIGCPSYHYANSRYLLEIREKRMKSWTACQLSSSEIHAGLVNEHVRQKEAQKFFSFKNRNFTSENFDYVIRLTPTLIRKRFSVTNYLVV